MNKRTYDERRVVTALNKNPNIKVDSIQHIIEITNNATTIGNSSWGKIDYLVKVHGYVKVNVDTISKRFNTIKPEPAEPKRKKKDIDIVSSVKINLKSTKRMK